MNAMLSIAENSSSIHTSTGMIFDILVLEQGQIFDLQIDQIDPFTDPL